MKLFPESAAVQLEFDKIKALLIEHARSDYAKSRAADLRIHTKREFIELELQQSSEYMQILKTGLYFPNDFVLNLARELKLLGIQGAILREEQLVDIRKLAETTKNIFRWFDPERRSAYTALAKLIEDLHFEKQILLFINEVLDEQGIVKDNASEALAKIRMSLYRKRNELRRVFDKVLSKWNKAGYVADIEEAFLNGRRVVAIHAEYKRQVKGILLGESDTRKTSFMEPEETFALNNELLTLENDERYEVHKILRELTAKLSVHAGLLNSYHSILGEYDFICAKAKLGIAMNAIESRTT